MKTGQNENREPVSSATDPPTTQHRSIESGHSPSGQRRASRSRLSTAGLKAPRRPHPLLADFYDFDSRAESAASVHRDPAHTGVNRAFPHSATQVSATQVSATRDDTLPLAITDGEIEAIRHSSAAMAKKHRESMYLGELLSLFRQRIYFLANLAIIFLPFFALLHAILSPQLRTSIGFVHCCLVALCVIARFAAPHLRSLFQARLLSLGVYALMSFGVAVITVQLSDNDFDKSFQNQFIAYSSYNEIVLSLLLLPYSIWECLTVITIVSLTMFWSAYWTTPAGLESFHYSHMLILSTSAVVVMCVAHFQSILRRQAFDSTFDLAQSAAQMELLCTLDTVTGGFNRHYLERALDIEVARAARFGRPLSLIMFDLDNFKAVNDQHGHAAGDEVLREVLCIATATIREIDTVVRYGGDEFMILLPETGKTATQAIAERLQENTRCHLISRFGEDTPEGQVTLSIGVLTVELDEPVPLETLIERVDERLYEAKRSGKDRIAV